MVGIAKGFPGWERNRETLRSTRETSVSRIKLRSILTLDSCMSHFVGLLCRFQAFVLSRMESNGGNLKESLISRILAIFYGFNLIVETFVRGIFTTTLSLFRKISLLILSSSIVLRICKTPLILIHFHNNYFSRYLGRCCCCDYISSKIANI